MTYLFRSAGAAPRLAEGYAPVHPGFSVPALLQELHSEGIAFEPSWRRELENLAREADPRFLAEGLYSLARRVESEGRVDAAAAVYRYLDGATANAPLASEEGASSCRQYGLRSRERLRVLAGGGSFGERSEFFLRHFAREASDPGLLFGMAAAGSVFRLTRALALGRLAGTPLLGSTGVRLLANAAGFAAEAPTFVLANRGVRAALGLEHRGPQDSLGREIAASYLTLGAMKLAGGVTARLHRRWLGAAEARNASGRISELLFPQAGMLAGILLGHRLEQWAGLRPAQSGSSLLAESLATLLHFNVSGRLFHHLSGPEFRAWELAMDRQAEVLLVRHRPLPAGLAMAMPGVLPIISPILRPEEDPLRPSWPEEGRSGVRAITAEGSGSSPESISADLSIPELLGTYSQLWRENSSAQPRILLPEGFARRLADWGYEWQEAMTWSFGPEFANLRRIHESVARGEAPSNVDLEYLRGLAARSEAQAADFEANRQTLFKIFLQSRRRPGWTPRPEDAATERVLHDLSHRPELLQILGLAANDLQAGIPLEDFYLQRLQAQRGFTLGQTLKEGVVMAAAESSELVSRVGRGLRLDGLDELHLKQGSMAARGLGDILANLLTNAWRYRRSDDLAVRVDTRPMPDGSVQISVSDDGIGIQANNLLSLGGHGFRESRVDLKTSHGFGLASVVENLRRLNWGPLWVRSRVGEGSVFRFEIPGDRLLVGEGAAQGRVPPVDRYGRSGMTRLEANLDAGFVVPATSLDLAVHQLMGEVPPEPFLHEELGETGHRTRLQALKAGSLRHRRLEILHRLLAAGRPVEDLQTIENGPGTMVDTAWTLLRLGSPLQLKEPELSSVGWHFRSLRRLATPAELERVQYFRSEQIDHSAPSDIVYWPNPDPNRLVVPKETAIEDYLGRDVRPGGFLVIQSDHHLGAFSQLRALELNPLAWEKIFDAELPNLHEGTNQILPTAQGSDLHLKIFRRKPEAAANP
ncbi:MAG: ATP-binding protein [bacterium]